MRSGVWSETTIEHGLRTYLIGLGTAQGCMVHRIPAREKLLIDDSLENPYNNEAQMQALKSAMSPMTAGQSTATSCLILICRRNENWVLEREAFARFAGHPELVPLS